MLQTRGLVIECSEKAELARHQAHNDIANSRYLESLRGIDLPEM